MIFSLSPIRCEIQIPHLENTDIICFFSSENAVETHEKFWFEILLSSLKMKRFVLVLRADFKELPQLDFSQRWQIGEAWMWVAPRAYSVLSETYPDRSLSFENLSAFLKTSK